MKIEYIKDSAAKTRHIWIKVNDITHFHLVENEAGLLNAFQLNKPEISGLRLWEDCTTFDEFSQKDAESYGKMIKL